MYILELTWRNHWRDSTSDSTFHSETTEGRVCELEGTWWVLGHLRSREQGGKRNERLSTMCMSIERVQRNSSWKPPKSDDNRVYVIAVGPIAYRNPIYSQSQHKGVEGVRKWSQRDLIHKNKISEPEIANKVNVTTSLSASLFSFLPEHLQNTCNYIL